MCPEQDSNLHASQHAHLKRARLPFRHLGNNHYFIEHAPCAFFVRAENEARTRDPNLGKVVLYQLSYFRICITKNKAVFAFAVAKVDIFRKPANNYRTFLIRIDKTSFYLPQQSPHSCANITTHYIVASPHVINRLHRAYTFFAACLHPFYSELIAILLRAKKNMISQI